MADLGAFFGNPNLQRQGARARALASQRDVNTLADPLTYAAVQGLLGTRPDEMGFSVLNPNYEKIKKVAEPAFALGLLGQAAPALAPLTKGLPVGASIKNVGDDLLSYRGSHKAPNAKTYGATLDDLTKILPEDVYTQQGKQLYGIGDKLIDSEWRIAALKARGKPDAEIEVFRAVPKGVKTINDGDWVSTSKKYAKDHGENTLNGEYDIISKKVKAKTLSTEGYPYEYGYNEIPTAPRQEALDTAQRNAALPIEEGGLGLPKDNTPEMRAEAMGYKTPAYHGTNVWEAEDGRKLGDIEAFNRLASTEIVGRKPSIDQMGIWASDRPDASGAGMYSGSQGAIYPLMLRMENPKATSFEQMARTASNLSTNKALGAGEVPRVSDVEPYRQRLKEQGYDSLMLRAKEGSPYTEFVDQTGYVLLEPNQVRSRFAAFDPKRRNEPDILAGVLPLGLLADEEQRKKLYELMPSLLGQ